MKRFKPHNNIMAFLLIFSFLISITNISPKIKAANETETVPTETPIPTITPEVTEAPTTTPTPTATPAPTPMKPKPKFKGYWTKNYDVDNIYSTSGSKVTIKPTNKLAKSKYVKKIKNGKTAQIIFAHYCKKGKYIFKVSCEETKKYRAASVKWTVTAN